MLIAWMFTSQIIHNMDDQYIKCYKKGEKAEKGQGF